jgi:hypothetical protein
MPLQIANGSAAQVVEQADNPGPSASGDPCAPEIESAPAVEDMRNDSPGGSLKCFC